MYIPNTEFHSFYNYDLQLLAYNLMQEYDVNDLNCSIYTLNCLHEFIVLFDVQTFHNLHADG